MIEIFMLRYDRNPDRVYVITQCNVSLQDDISNFAVLHWYQECGHTIGCIPVTHSTFVKVRTTQIPSFEVEKEFLSLPHHFGGLNIPNPTTCSDFQFSSSRLQLLSASLYS